MKSFDLVPPAPITGAHEAGEFDSGERSLNEWLKKRALRYHAAGARAALYCARERK